jgi:AcrR family transcriptional regulator
VIDAALELMLERGYSATTMTAIAEHAGVAERTVYNLFRSKAGLMLATLRDLALGGEEQSLRADHAHMWGLDDPGEIIRFAVETNHRVASRALSLFRVAYQAAAVEPEVAEALAQLEEFRFQYQGEIVDMLKEKGFLRSDIPFEVLKRGFWLLAGPETAIKALDAGWDLDTYSGWLRDSLPRLLLDEGGWEA